MMYRATTKYFLAFSYASAVGSLLLGVFLTLTVYASHGEAPNISTVNNEHYAWNDIAGWLDFADVTVKAKELTGYAVSSIGDDPNTSVISLNCKTAVGGGDICATSNYKVINDGQGFLFGYAWSDAVGWIRFCGGGGDTNPVCQGSIYHQVVIDLNGNFSGYAWNDLLGWISFCGGGGSSCFGGVSHKVKTSWFATSSVGWLESGTFDTGSGGAQINSILWNGVLPGGTAVRFHIASKCVDGLEVPPACTAWDFVGPNDTSDLSDSYPPGGVLMGPNISIPIHYSLHEDARYFRYKAYLISDLTQTYTPWIDQIIVNWSP